MNKQKLYSHNKEFPSPLPERIVMKDGTVYTSTFELSEEQLKNLGFDGPYYYPDFVGGYQKVICDFDREELIVVDMSEDEKQKKISEKWETIRSIRNKLLNKTDWIVIQSIEKNEIVPSNYFNYRQELRDIPQKYSDPNEVVYPTIYHN